MNVTTTTNKEGNVSQFGTSQIMQFAERVETLVMKLAKNLDINEGIDIASDDFGELFSKSLV